MDQIEVMMMSDKDLIDRMLCEGGSTVKFSPELDQLKEEMCRRLGERHRRVRGPGWGTADPVGTPNRSS